MDIFKKIRLLTTSLFILVSSVGFAQGDLNYWSFGPYVGTLNSSTDVATTASASALINEIRPQIGFQADYYFNSIFGIGTGVNLGWVYAADANHTNPQRGLEISSRFAAFESHVIVNLRRFGRFRRFTKWAPYFRLGGGINSLQTFNLGEANVPSEATWYEGTTVNGFWNVGFGAKFKLGFSRSIEIEINGSIMPSDRLEGFVYPSSGASDYYGGIRVRYSFMSIMGPNTF